jgi:copper homeostasis protein
MILEIAVFNIGSAILAAQSGADRLELCENPSEGGTTSSYGTLKTVREKITIPVFPIIRPRGGDFLFTEDEFAVMKKDIALCKQLQFDGIVIGLLNRDGTVDAERTKQLTALAYPMEITFHRAFDRAKDPLSALETIIACGCNRLLTSGQVPNAWDGKELIKQLIEKAGDRIIIMPGSGVRSNNIKELAAFTGAVELHSSARRTVSSPMSFVQAGMNETLENICVNTEEIKKMRSLLSP